MNFYSKLKNEINVKRVEYWDLMQERKSTSRFRFIKRWRLGSKVLMARGAVKYAQYIYRTYCPHGRLD